VRRLLHLHRISTPNLATQATPQHDLAEHGYDTPLLGMRGWSGEGRVVDVYDGDSAHIVVRFRGEPARVRVRILGIDTCEIRDSDAENRAHAYAARDRVLSLITDTPASAWTGVSWSGVRDALAKACHIVHVDCEDTDRYGRTLVKMSANGNDIGETLVREGLAYVYDGGERRSGDGVAESMQTTEHAEAS